MSDIKKSTRLTVHIILITCLLSTGCDPKGNMYTGSSKMPLGVVTVALENRIKETGFVEGKLEFPGWNNQDASAFKNQQIERGFLNESNVFLVAEGEKFNASIVQPYALADSKKDNYFIAFEKQNEKDAELKDFEIRIFRPELTQDTIIIPLQKNLLK